MYLSHLFQSNSSSPCQRCTISPGQRRRYGNQRDLSECKDFFFCNFQSWRQITATEGVYSVEMDLPVLATHWTRPLHLNMSYERRRSRKKAPVTTSTTSYFLLFVWLSVYSAADSLNVFFSLSSSGSEYE